MNRPSADEAKEAVRNATDIVQLVGEKVRLRRVGTRWSGLCPFHAEKTPSFTVNPERQIWHCFGCSKGGDAFAWMMETEKVTFPEALAILADRAGIELPKGERGPGAAARDRLYQATALASDFFQKALREDGGKKARAYLSGRGFTGPILDQFHVGYAPEGWDALATTLGKLTPMKSLEDAGLTLKRGDGSSYFDRFRNRVIFPVEIAPGKTAGFGARAIVAEDNPKYLNSPETALFRKGSLLFGLPQARSSIRDRKQVLVAEGYLDVLRLHANGFTNAVATCGTALTIEHARALARFEADVVLVYDGDAAGIRAADRALDPLLSVGLAARVLLLPAGEDPDSLLAKSSPAVFSVLVAEARDVPGFLAEASLGGSAGSAGAGVGAGMEPGASKRTDPSLEARVRRFVTLLERVGDPIRRRLLVRRGSEAFGLEEAVLLEALTKKGKPGAKPAGARTAPGGPGASKGEPAAGGDGSAGAEAPRGVTAEALDPAERELAARALTEEGALMALAASGGVDVFPTPELRDILAPWIESGQPPLEEERDRLVAEQPLVRGILAVHPVEEAVPLEDQRKTASGLIERLEDLRLRARLAALDRAIREAEHRRDEALGGLVAERRDLASKLHQRSHSPVS